MVKRVNIKNYHLRVHNVYIVLIYFFFAFKVQVLYDFQAETSSELSVHYSEELTVIDDVI